MWLTKNKYEWQYDKIELEDLNPVSFSGRNSRFLVGSAHVRSQATVHAFMHAAHAVCMRAEDIAITRFKERASLAFRKYPYPRSRDENRDISAVTIYTS